MATRMRAAIVALGLGPFFILRAAAAETDVVPVAGPLAGAPARLTPEAARDGETVENAGQEPKDADARDVFDPTPPDPLNPLSAEDAARYIRIFDLQDDGRWAAADREIAALEDDILMGHVIEQRLMHPTDHRATFSELKDWMANYSDHPGARRVYRLARIRRPSAGVWVPRPEPAPARLGEDVAKNHPDFAGRSAKARLSEPYVRRLVRRGQITKARAYLDRDDVVAGLSEAERDRLLARVAYARLLTGDAQAAFDDAAAVADRRGDAVPLAHKTAGLAAFRMRLDAEADAHFTALMDHQFASEADRALGGFWAGRARLRRGAADGVAPAFEAAAAHGFEFYGLLAGAVLGREPIHLPERPEAGERDVLARVSAAFPSAKRAAALVQVGRRGDADEELRLLFRRAKEVWDDDLLAFAAALQLPATQYEIAEASAEGAAEALFPLPAYEPAGGFEVDRALVYAIMRQESRFKTEAVSRAGARGLMQIMPRTASFIARDRTLRYRSRRRELLEPTLNLALAQDYVAHLNEDWTGGDMVRTLIAYNGGPGNLRKWERRIGADVDTLLFIESVPNSESRHYVKAVLRNMWIYRARLGQKAETLQALAEGRAALYAPQDPGGRNPGPQEAQATGARRAL